nr:carbonic anhydrase [Sulfurifustis variabilis]
MATSIDEYIRNNRKYAGKTALHNAAFPGPKPIRPARRLAVVACMDARLDVEDLLGLQTGDAHIIRNAGGVVSEDVIRCLVISHHLLDTNEIVLIHHTRCGMLAFTDVGHSQPPLGPDRGAGRDERARIRLRRGHRSARRGVVPGSDGIDRLTEERRRARGQAPCRARRTAVVRRCGSGPRAAGAARSP